MTTKNVDLTRKKLLYVGMLTPAHSRAARGWLDWTQEDLAKRASVSLSTVRDFEKRRRVPIANNIAALRRVLEAEGVAIIDDQDGLTGILTRARKAELEMPHGDADHA